MSEAFDPDWGVELWRGGVMAWECDQFGHMNVRFYLDRAAEALMALTVELGLPDAFRREASATVRPLGWHVRYLKEARAGAPLRLTGGITALGDTWGEAAMVMTHAASGAPAAAFRTRFAHVTSEADRPFPWPARVAAEATRLAVDAPDISAPRGLDAMGWSAPPDPLGEAGGMPVLRGVFGSQDCDVFGRVRGDAVIARDVSGGMSMGQAMQDKAAATDPAYVPPGRAVLEYRIRHFGQPRAGDRFVGVNGVSRLDARAFRTSHRMIDPATGALWAASENLVGAFDLASRKLVPLHAAERAAMEPRLIAGLDL